MRRSRLILSLVTVGALLPAGIHADPAIAYGEASVDYSESPAKRSAMLPPWSPVISDDLASVIRDLRTASTKEERDARMAVTADFGRPRVVLAGEQSELVQVIIATTDTAAETIDAIKALGVTIEFVSTQRPIIRALVPIDGIEKVAALPRVREITRPVYGIPTAGVSQTRADLLMGTQKIRNTTGVNGLGTRVAVFSNGLFTASSALPSNTCNDDTVHRANSDETAPYDTDLPISPFNDCDEVPFSGWYGGIQIFPANRSEHVIDNRIVRSGYPEGSAMMEVIHDVAPGARMFYGTATDDTALEERRTEMFGGAQLGVNYPSNPLRIDIVAENLVFVGAGRPDGSSLVSIQATDLSRRFNIPWFVSAGSATPAAEVGDITTVRRFPAFITGFFNPDPRKTTSRVHSWNTNSTTLRDEALNVSATEDGSEGYTSGDVPIEATLVWDDFWSDTSPRARVDLDLYLVPRSTLSVSDALAASTRLQNGSNSNPVERLVFYGTITEPVALVIVSKGAVTSDKLLFTLALESGVVEESKYLTHGTAVANADALFPVVSVGEVDPDRGYGEAAASDFIMPGLVPGFNGQTAYVRWFETQKSPTIVGFGSVATTTTSRVLGSGARFTGPSAAVSHMAGFASLLRHRYPQMPSYRFSAILTDTSGIDKDGNDVQPAALRVVETRTAIYDNPPVFVRPVPSTIYRLLEDGSLDPYAAPTATRIALPDNFASFDVADAGSAPGGLLDAATDGESGWSKGTEGAPDGAAKPDFINSELGLELRPGSGSSYGYWQSPLLSVQGEGDTVATTKLRTDRLYLVEARVGTNESNASRVPDFRLSVKSGEGNESYGATIGNAAGTLDNVPSTLGGRTYQIFFRPSTQAIADAGFRFVFELISSSATDSADASVVLRDLTIRELPLPAEATQAESN